MLVVRRVAQAGPVWEGDMSIPLEGLEFAFNLLAPTSYFTNHPACLWSGCGQTEQARSLKWTLC